MAVTVQMQFASVITELYQDAFVGSSIENGATIIQFDLRKHDFQRELGTTSPICWRKDPYHVYIQRRFPRSEILQQSGRRLGSVCPENRMTCDGKVERFILPSG